MDLKKFLRGFKGLAGARSVQEFWSNLTVLGLLEGVRQDSGGFRHNYSPLLPYTLLNKLHFGLSSSLKMEIWIPQQVPGFLINPPLFLGSPYTVYRVSPLTLECCRTETERLITMNSWTWWRDTERMEGHSAAGPAWRSCEQQTSEYRVELQLGWCSDSRPQGGCSSSLPPPWHRPLAGPVGRFGRVEGAQKWKSSCASRPWMPQHNVCGGKCLINIPSCCTSAHCTALPFCLLYIYNYLNKVIFAQCINSNCSIV